MYLTIIALTALYVIIMSLVIIHWGLWAVLVILAVALIAMVKDYYGPD
jgi:hypothetical protein